MVVLLIQWLLTTLENGWVHKPILKVLKGLKVHKDQQVLKELRVHKVHKVLKELKEVKALRDLQVLKELKVLI